ncbi:MAG: PD-(D/E)XK nuclease family protein [Bacteroidales bacterium]|nr:PD-(D/E)XK nuclease family protein [Bacteroidales bacterium]
MEKDQLVQPSGECTGFLRQVAAYLHRAYGEQLHRFCIVFPNIRAGLFFRKYLAALSDRPVWSPAFRSMNSLMEEIAGWTESDRVGMVFDLYQAYREHKPTAESFDEFYFWGEMLLDDFDDIDKHLVDARDLFRNVSDLKEIDQLFDYLSEDQKNAIRIFWQDFNGGKTGALKADFATVWPSLHLIYHSFKKRLQDKSLGYEGMIQREAVRLIRSNKAGNTGYERYVFIGFNALNPCEKYFFKSLQKQDKAMFFWDYDDYYLNHKWHEAGIFMRENIRQFPSEWHIDSQNLTDKAKEMEVISVPSETGQAGMAGQILNGMPAGIDWDRTAVVLPDEHLLLPVLSSIPQEIRDINITMGYPFVFSPANSLFERLALLQQRVRIYSGVVKFYHHDVNMVLHHPYIQNIASKEADEAIRDTVEHNRIYVSVEEMTDHPLFRMLFRKCSGAGDFIAYLLEAASEIIGWIKKNEDTEAHISANEQYQLEYLYTFYTSLQRIGDIFSSEQIDMEVHVFCRLMRKVFASLKIPFSGEPLKGLQVMGMLETRVLDFEHVIILSMNEGIIPKPNPRQSFIPYNLRKGFGLTTSERYDAISAYHFYRLIQRASNIHLIYNSAATDRNTGEMSRFISQLIYEPAFEVRKRDITFHVRTQDDREIIHERTADIRKLLALYCSQGEGKRMLSPSALNTYLDCRLRFYFRYIEGLEEQEQVIDEIDPSVFGLLLHKTMEDLYRPYLNEVMSVELLTQIQKNTSLIDETLLKAFAEHYFHSRHVDESDITGRNIIIREVLLKYIHRVIEVDKAAAPFTLLGLEEKLNIPVPVSSISSSATVNMYGIIDRIECRNEALYIIDYKTGNASRKFRSVPDLFDRNKNGNHAVMQTLVYACMAKLVYPGYRKINSGLYVVKDLFREPDYDPRISIIRQDPLDNYFDVSKEFEYLLNELLAEMFLSDVPFTQTPDEKKCLNCLYADICHRKRG